MVIANHRPSVDESGKRLEKRTSEPASENGPAPDEGPENPRPSCFSETSVLFAGSGFDGPYDSDLDRLQAGMLDGRTIHFHFQFVEPELLGQYPAAECGAPGIALGALSPRLLALCKTPSLAGPHAEIECSYGSTYLLHCAQQDAAALRSLVEASLHELAQIGLDWLPVLSIGAFVIGTEKVQPPTHCAALALLSSPGEAAARITVQAAASIARMWVEAEWLRGRHSREAFEAACEFASDLFASLLLAEFHSRSGHTDAETAHSDRREVVLADFPLTRHLLNFWDRAWYRQAYLSGSAFDYAPTLEALYEGWQA